MVLTRASLLGESLATSRNIWFGVAASRIFAGAPPHNGISFLTFTAWLRPHLSEDSQKVLSVNLEIELARPKYEALRPKYHLG